MTLYILVQTDQDYNYNDYSIVAASENRKDMELLEHNMREKDLSNETIRQEFYCELEKFRQANPFSAAIPAIPNCPTHWNEYKEYEKKCSTYSKQFYDYNCEISEKAKKIIVGKYNVDVDEVLHSGYTEDLEYSIVELEKDEFIWKQRKD